MKKHLENHQALDHESVSLSLLEVLNLLAGTTIGVAYTFPQKASQGGERKSE